MQPRALLLASLSLLSVLVGQSRGAENGALGTVDLCGNWAFAYTTSRTEGLPPAETFKTFMPVPGCWDDTLDGAKARTLWPNVRVNPEYQPIRFPTDNNHLQDASFPFLLGTGWYRREVDVPAAWKGRQITLQVARVVMDAWVYVGGREVHHHLGHSTNWEVPLGPHLKFGQPNDLMIAVDNTRTDRANSSIINGWAGRSAGIFGPATLRVAGAARIADVYLFPDKNQLHWRVEVEGDLPVSSQLRWQIRDPKTKQVVAGGTQQGASGENRWATDTFGLQPWSDRQSDLYEIEVGLHAGEDCLDTCRQPFGLRRLTAAGTGLRLNGQPIFLRGDANHSYYPLTCTPPTDLAWYRQHVRRLKEIGFNWLRFHTSVPLEPFLEAADELGMLVQVEPPVNYALSEWRDILRACRRHPSVVIYCCGNEDLLNETKIEYLRQCEAELRKTVPDALFNPQEALRGIEYGWAPTDMGSEIVKEPFHHNPKRLKRLQEFSDVFGQFTWGWLSYNNLDGEPDQIDRRLAIYQRPCLTHELGIAGCYINLALQDRYRRLRVGQELYAAAREQLEKAGLLDRAEVYYRNSAAWQRLMLKDQMETARACRLISGYDCLGATDGQWLYCGYECGLLSEFDELKPGRTTEDIRCYNGQSVLMISRQRDRNLVAGQPFQRKLLLSWFGEEVLRNAPVHWSLQASEGTVLASGNQVAPELQTGTVAPVGTIDAPLPKLQRATKATLTVELESPGGRVRNQWDYWLFPRGEPAAPDNVRVVTELDAATIDALAAGQRVVLFGSKPFPARGTTFRIASAGRAEGNLATVIARHPLSDQFPSDGFCDWQFFRMLSDAAAVQFDEIPEAFDPIIEVVSSYKQIHRQAAVFEWRVGSGRLLVCSLNLHDGDPAGAYFRRCLLSYASGPQFQPRIEVAPQRLKQLLKLAPAVIGPAANPNQAFDPRRNAPAKKD